MQVDLTPEALEAVAERVLMKLTGTTYAPMTFAETMSCAEFATRIGRSPRWVADRCRRRQFKTVAGRRPYRIVSAELARVLS